MSDRLDSLERIQSKMRALVADNVRLTAAAERLERERDTYSRDAAILADQIRSAERQWHHEREHLLAMIDELENGNNRRDTP